MIYIYYMIYIYMYIYIYIKTEQNHIAWILWILVVCWGHQTPLQYGTGPTASERRSSSESTGRASLSQVSLCMSSAELGRWMPLDVWLGRSWKWRRPRTTRVSRSSRFVSQSLADLSRRICKAVCFASKVLGWQTSPWGNANGGFVFSMHEENDFISPQDSIYRNLWYHTASRYRNLLGSQTCPFAIILP